MIMAITTNSTPTEVVQEINNKISGSDVVNSQTSSTTLPYSATYCNNNFALSLSTIATALGITVAQLNQLVELAKITSVSNGTTTMATNFRATTNGTTT